MPQTAYALDPSVATPGLIGSHEWKAETRIAHEDLPYGRFVSVRADGTVELPNYDADVLAGVTVYVGMHEVSTYPQDTTAPNVIKAGEPCTVLYQGDVWVSRCETDAITELEDLIIANDHTDVTKRGMVTGKSTSADVRRAVTRGKFINIDKATTAMAKIRINLP